MLADRGFDRDGLRDALAAAGLRLPAPPGEGRTRPTRSDGRRVRRYRRRHIVARTFGRRHSDRRLLVRHEFDAPRYDGSVHPACALIAGGEF